MPLTPSPTRPEAGSLSSFILYHLERGATQAEIYNLARDRAARFTVGTFNKLYSHLNESEIYGRRFNTFSENTPLSRLRVPSIGTECDTIRLSFQALINDPGSGRGGSKRSVGFTIDTPYEGTVGDAIGLAEDYVRRWISENYDVSSRGVSRRSVNIKVTRVECF